MTDIAHTATHLILHGRVQGVFYRDWTVENARLLGLRGWVRNLSDGTVEAHLEGEEGAIARMVDAMRDGPPRARVDRIEQSTAQPQGFDGFERR
ncbi:acylphosphatase [Alteriqipengyuania lutimaris]|uniref:acylphosphatase n=1 Tax=Alteriqipengyuania lutimaris TaxID=1538146 RepID=A0A395LTE0_9SPHN|nr:acylphosphatase [Alteriqipengyuania lutimaris]MBB3033155.1 acylphosphatase [Alteriqipengyuania lutimaris]RDS77790.1 acylphosphatase [Alteriqipengyuania lutimaris]